MWRRERFGHWGETGEKIHVLAFYTSWSGFKSDKCRPGQKSRYFNLLLQMAQVIVGKQQEVNIWVMQAEENEIA